MVNTMDKKALVGKAGRSAPGQPRRGQASAVRSAKTDGAHAGERAGDLGPDLWLNMTARVGCGVCFPLIGCHRNLRRCDVSHGRTGLAEFVYETTASAVEEKKKLRRNFRRFDMFFYLICTVVTLDTIGAVAANGAQGFTWLIFLGIFFFLPYGLSIAELGSAFPQEGGPDVWSRLAFGRKIAAVNAVIYWISNPIWVGG